VATLDEKQLCDVMKFEVLRIILEHPYERRKANKEFAWVAGNLSIRECTQTSLKMPTAPTKFGTKRTMGNSSNTITTCCAGQDSTAMKTIIRETAPAKTQPMWNRQAAMPMPTRKASANVAGAVAATSPRRFSSPLMSVVR